MAITSTKGTKKTDSDFVISVPSVNLTPMKLIVISPEAEDPREHTVLVKLFAAGLTSYHLRKPTWTREQLAEYLRALSADFRRRLRNMGWNAPDGESPILPIMVGDAERAQVLSRRLQEQRIHVPAIRPPTVPPGTSRLRVSLSARHTAAELDELAEQLAKNCAFST